MYIFYPLVLCNLDVQNFNMSTSFYLVTFKLAKHEMAAKVLIKPRIFYALSHMKAKFMISGRFLFYKYISSVFVKK